MISKNEYLYNKIKLHEMEDQLFDFENKGEIYPIWKKYIALSETDKQIIAKEWESYYAACRNGYRGLIFNLAKTAFKQNDNPLLNSLIQQGKESKVLSIRQPSSIDPEELKMKMNKYYEYKHEAKQIKDLVEEYKPIYEPGKNEDRYAL